MRKRIAVCQSREDGRCGHPDSFIHGRRAAPLICSRCELYEPSDSGQTMWVIHRRPVGEAPRPVSGLIDQAQRYLRAELSLLREGPVPLAIYRQRVAQCRQKVADPKDGRAYCAGCGCGARQRAKLDVKMHMPLVSCPHCGIEPHPGEGRKHLKRLGGIRKQMSEVMRSAIKDYRLTVSDVRRLLRQPDE